MDNVLTVFSPIERMEKQSDGTIKVFVNASAETVDDQNEVIDWEGNKAAVDEFMKFANVREMHQPIAAGVAEYMEHDDVLHKTTGVLHIVDPVAVQKVETGVYKGVSWGGWKRGRVTDPVLSKASGKSIVRIMSPIYNEMSLVDRPSRPDATLTLMKVAGIEEPEDDGIDSPAFVEEAPVAPEHALPPVDGDEDLTKASGPAPDATDDAPAVAASDVAAGAPSPEEPLEKRQMDEVGGEKVDRDKIAGGDFAGPDRSFPITNADSVKAAAHLVGKAADPGAVRDRIVAIAERKNLTAALPKSWNIAKSSDAGQDVAQANNALEMILCLLACEYEEGEAEDVGYLSAARDAMLQFIESEAKEVGTEQDKPEEPVTMAYAAVIGDLAKMAGGALPPHARALRAMLDADTTSQAPQAPVTLPDEAMSKIAASVVAQIGQPLTKADLGAMEASITRQGEMLAKVAAQPVNSGPLRYAMDDRRFSDLASLLDGRTNDRDEGVEVLRKAAAATTDPIVREALGKAVAAAEISNMRNG